MSYLYTRPAKFGVGYDVMEVTKYNDGCLKGQDKITFLDSFETIEECHKHYPESRGTFHNSYTEPRNTFDHLPDTPDGYEWDGE